MKHQAVRNLYPSVNVIQELETGLVCTDSNGEAVEIDMDAVLVESNRLRIEYDKKDYIRKRAPEYPYLAELADALYWQSKGDNSKMEAYIQAVESVKLKYPKSE